MTDYRNLSNWEKAKVDKMINDTIEPKHHVNTHNGFEWDEPDLTLKRVHAGHCCADCLMVYYNCLCSHD